MNKIDFLDFYTVVFKKLALRFTDKYTQFKFCDNPDALYEEYLNQKTMLRVLYGKKNKPDKTLLDRHKVCACMTVAIIKVRLLSEEIETDQDYSLSSATRINEQLAFMSTWELFLGFVRLHKSENREDYKLPETYHNNSFLDTFTRSLFFANQLNSLSTPLIANIFYLLEKYCEMEQQKNIIEQKLNTNMTSCYENVICNKEQED